MYPRVAALPVVTTRSGVNEPTMAIITMGVVYWSLGLYDEAKPLLENALALREEYLEPDDPVMAGSIGDLADLRWKMGEFEEARQLHQRALDIKIRVFGPEHPEVASALNNLANQANEAGEYEEAISLYRQAIL